MHSPQLRSPHLRLARQSSLHLRAADPSCCRPTIFLTMNSQALHSEKARRTPPSNPLRLPQHDRGPRLQACGELPRRAFALLLLPWRLLRARPASALPLRLSAPQLPRVGDELPLLPVRALARLPVELLLLLAPEHPFPTGVELLVLPPVLQLLLVEP